jgi:hypothetical protein
VEISTCLSKLTYSNNRVLQSIATGGREDDGQNKFSEEIWEHLFLGCCQLCYIFAFFGTFRSNI